MSYRGLCERCREEVNPEKNGRRAAYPVTGFEVEREGGGANQIRNRERVPGVVFHEGCLPDPRLNDEQQKLL
jgi:hypothetical protein